MWFWRRFFSFSVLTVSFRLGLGLGLEPLWTRTWLRLEPLWTWTWLGLEPLWTWTCLGLEKGGLDYSPTYYCQLVISFLPIALLWPHGIECSLDAHFKISIRIIIKTLQWWLFYLPWYEQPLHPVFLFCLFVFCPILSPTRRNTF